MSIGSGDARNSGPAGGSRYVPPQRTSGGPPPSGGGAWAPRSSGGGGGYQGGGGGYQGGGGGYSGRGGFGGGGGAPGGRPSWTPSGGGGGGGYANGELGARPGPGGGGRGGGGGYQGGGGGGFGGGGSRGVGHWDPSTGHVPAPRDDRMEAELFRSTHVTTGINFAKYDDIPVEASGTGVPEPVLAFENAKLAPLLSENIELAGYKHPTPVQKYSIPIVEAGRDLMACAQTGSGKTAGFLFPILNELFLKGPPPERPVGGRGPIMPVALILSPTRELTSQIHDEARRFAYRSWVRPVVVYGGVPLREQAMSLRRGCELLVATPGRLSDLIERQYVSLRHVKYLILDEADRMLDMGFEPQIRRIVEQEDMPPQDQRVTLMFSATFPREIQFLARDFLGDYIFLSVGRVGAASENVKQRVIQVLDHEKRDVLLDILTVEPASENNLTLIFVETKRMADMLANFLYDNQFPATAIHGDRDQRERERALVSFRTARTPIMVATAVAARGLDIPNVTHVINYDLPNDIDDYVHRIGRTGRAGNEGVATAFFSPEKNNNIVRELLTILRDANQEVPDFLERMASASHFGGGRSSGGRGGRGRGGHRQATRDFRQDSEYKTFTPAPRDSWGGGGGGGDSWGPSGGQGGGNYW
ncbi:P-loop containing nucleoside triphosphate hydrolase protein [Blastocladiella britannica]|nr:P-loop containing nucleoside triphosphate hydrolase protein [Blastocladiella britannica]